MERMDSCGRSRELSERTVLWEKQRSRRENGIMGENGELGQKWGII